MFHFILPPWLAYMQARVDLADGTKVGYARVARMLLAEPDIEIHDATADLTPIVDRRRQAGIAPRTIAYELRVAAMAFRWAQRTGLLGAALGLRVPRVRIDGQQHTHNHRTPTLEEALRAIDAMPRDDWWLAALVMARTGARVGEVVRLRASDLDEHAGWVVFGRAVGASKTGRRRVPLDGGTAELLRGRSSVDDSPLFALEGAGRRGRGRTTVAPVQALERRLLEACDAAGVRRFTPHGLRRMVVTRMLRSGVDPSVAAAVTGHSVATMLRYYRQIGDDELRAAVERATAIRREPPREPLVNATFCDHGAHSTRSR
ncbi:MAG: site-specific integrase [Alphaproteobacteria bacterium]|nr:site-specific integrase [Alphaproteobacteria bacterium]